VPAVDVAIVGGGVSGVSTAAFLSEAGLRVRLYERTAIAAGASGRNSGIVQHPFDPVLAGLYRLTLAEYRILADASAGAFVFGAAPAGLLYVGHDPGLAERTALEWAAAWPATLPQVVAGPDLRALEPGLAADLAACRLDVGYPVAPAAATEAFALLARRRGVEFVIGEDARPAIEGGRVVGVALDGRIEPAGAVVVAAGPWTPELVDPTGAWRPIRPSWGVVATVMLDAAPRHGLEAIDITIEPGDEPAVRTADDAVEFSLVPAAGSSALGSTFLPDEPDPAAWVDALRRVGARYVPRLVDAPVVAVRCCARPVSLDGRPLVGPVPWADGLWVLAGHGPWGISTGPGSARLIARAILADDAAAIPADLGVRRFGSPGSPPGQRQEFGSNR
jgi:glycine/D-amino acid oxidase-like deaminating enzyme